MSLLTALATTSLLLAAPPAALPPAPWEGPPFSGDPVAVAKAASALPRPAQHEAEVLLRETAVTFDAQGRATRSFRIVWRALTRDAARGSATVEARWSPWHQDRPEIRARVIDARGDVHELDPSTLSEGPLQDDDGPVFSDDRLVRAPLPGVDAGAVVEQLTLVRDREPLFAAGSTLRILAIGPARRMRVHVEAPSALPLRHAVRAAGFPAAVERVEGGRRVLSWDVSPLPEPAKWDPFAPPEDAAPPHVAVSTGKSWAAVGAAYAAVVERQLAGTDVRDLARRVGGGARTREEAVARVLAFIAERVRYTGLELGASSIVPAPPAEVLRRSYGDCKDLSVLAVALLRALGHEAHLALLRAEWDTFSPELPGLGELDHAIVHLPGRPTLWLDPTSPGTPVGRLPAPDQTRLALIADGKARKLESTPAASSAENRSVMTVELRLAEDGPADAVVSWELTGEPAGRARAMRRHRPEEKLKELDEKHVKEWLVADALVSVRWDGIEDATPGVRSRVEVRGSKMGVTAGPSAVAVVGMKDLFENLPAPLRERPKGETAPRKGPLVLREAFQSEIAYLVTPPPGYRVKSLPEGEAVRIGPASYESRYAALPAGTIEARHRLDTGGGRLTPREAEALRDKVAALIAAEAPRIHLERTSDALLAEGRGREAIAELRRLADLHPREARHRADLAFALVQLGMVDAARREAREAVALEPGSAWAHRALAWALEHDAVGRQAGPDADLPGAVAAMRRARELEPRVPETRLHLGWLLTHGERGVRYGAGAPLDQAIAELRFALKELEHPPAGELLLEALLAAGRPKEALPIAREQKPSPYRNGALVATAALAEGAAAALAEVQRLEAGDRTAALEGATLQLMAARRYADGADLLERGAAGSSSAASLRARAAMLRRIRPWDKVEIDERSPSSVALRLLAALIAPDPAARVVALMAAAQRAEAEKDSATETFRTALTAAFTDALPKPLTPVSGVDLALSLIETTAEGDPGALHRVRAKAFGMKDAMTLYAIEEGGTWKLAGIDGRPLLALFGAELDRLARAGRLDAARRVLSWARAQSGEIDGLTAELLSIVAPPSRDPAPREDLLGAAGVLSAIDPRPERSADLLRALGDARAGADGAAWRALGLRIAQTQLHARRWEAALATLREIRARDAAWLPAAEGELAALRAGERWDETRAAAEARLKGAPADRLALDTLIGLATRAGDLATGERWLRAAVAAGLERHNDLAWIQLYRDPVPREVLDHGRRAAQPPGRSRAAAHTLASAHAALGEPAEALQVLRESIPARGRINDVDWLVIGRAAESYGLLDDAAAAYRRVVEPPDPHPLSTYHLARRWLGALERRTRAGAPGGK